MDPLEAAANVLAGKQRILVYTGAGISTESGIPDFRGPDGVWTKIDPAEFTFQRYLASAETRRKSWDRRGKSGVLDAVPNSAHDAVVDLWRSGRMVGCVTQNIDGLHRKAGLPDDALVEVHGNARDTVCLGCDARLPTTEVASRVAGGEEDPACTDCGGILKVDVVFFGEPMPEMAMRIGHQWAGRADAVLAVGSTMGVFPAAYIPLGVVESGRPMVLLNRGDTEMDDLATVKLEGAAGEILPELVTRIVG